MKRPPLRLTLPQLPQHKPLRRRRTRKSLYVVQTFLFLCCASVFVLVPACHAGIYSVTSAAVLFDVALRVGGRRHICTGSRGRKAVSSALPPCVPLQFNLRSICTF